MSEWVKPLACRLNNTSTLLDARTLVVDVQGGDDALGDHPAPKLARGPVAHTPVEDQLLDLARPPEIQVLADHLFQEDPTRHRTVEYLGQRKLRLQDRQRILGGQRCLLEAWVRQAVREVLYLPAQ